MKLIIDIDDEQVLFDIKNRGLEAETETDKVIINALYNGIPLDDAKAEIKKEENIWYHDCDPDWKNFDVIRVDTVFEILDNIGKESEE